MAWLCKVFCEKIKGLQACGPWSYPVSSSQERERERCRGPAWELGLNNVSNRTDRPERKESQGKG